MDTRRFQRPTYACLRRLPPLGKRKRRWTLQLLQILNRCLHVLAQNRVVFARTLSDYRASNAVAYGSAKLRFVIECVSSPHLPQKVTRLLLKFHTVRTWTPCHRTNSVSLHSCISYGCTTQCLYPVPPILKCHAYTPVFPMQWCLSWQS